MGRTYALHVPFVGRRYDGSALPIVTINWYSCFQGRVCDLVTIHGQFKVGFANSYDSSIFKGRAWLYKLGLDNGLKRRT